MLSLEEVSTYNAVPSFPWKMQRCIDRLVLNTCNADPPPWSELEDETALFSAKKQLVTTSSSSQRANPGELLLIPPLLVSCKT